ncbi:hypothetical protein HRbin32_01970 [bacterium HR32]|nr:hypothetical protein HRbin32_01970 [bacterium HR32]
MSGPQDHEARHRLSLHFVGHAHRRRLADRGVGHEHRLHLRGPHALTRHLQGVVGASEDVPEPLLVPHRPVAVHPHAGPPGPVGVEVPLGIPPEPTRHAGPRLRHHQLAHLSRPGGPAVRVVHVRGHAQTRAREGARLARVDDGPAHDAPGHLRTPGVVHHGAARPTHLSEVPEVGVRVPRLARGTQHPEAVQPVPGRPVVPVPHQCPHRGGRDPEHSHAVPVHHLPEAAGVRGVRDPLVQHHAGPEGQGAQHQPGPHHPAHVCEPEHRVVRLNVEVEGHVARGLEGEASVHVDRPLGSPRGARGVDDHEGVHGPHALRGSLRRLAGYRLVPPDVPPGLPALVQPHPLHHQHVLHAGALPHRLVGHPQHGHDLPPAGKAVGGDHHLRLAVPHPRGDRVRGES